MAGLLVPFQGLLLDLVLAVYSSQQGPIHVGGRVLGEEVLAPIVQAHAGLLPQSSTVNDPVDLMLLQESDAPALSCFLQLSIGELLQEGLLLLLDRPEARHVEQPDLAGRDAEYLAQDGVRYVLFVILGSDQPAELQFDQVVHLLLAELFYHFRN